MKAQASSGPQIGRAWCCTCGHVGNCVSEHNSRVTFVYLFSHVITNREIKLKILLFPFNLQKYTYKNIFAKIYLILVSGSGTVSTVAPAGPARRLRGSDAARGTSMRERRGCGSTSGAARSHGTGVRERLGSTFFYGISTVLHCSNSGAADPMWNRLMNSVKTVWNSIKQCYMHACAAWLPAHARPACETARCRVASPRYRASVLRDHRSPWNGSARLPRSRVTTSGDRYICANFRYIGI